jgi:hypothetical protein
MSHLALFYLPTLYKPLTGSGYQAWSGVLGATAIFSGGVLIWRHKNCHEPWCWRLGKHPVAGTPYVVCHRHHPGLEGNRVKRGHIHAAHARHRETELRR